MAKETSVLKLPYPETTDSDNVPKDMKALAEAAEGAILGATTPGVKYATEALALTESYADVPGAKLEITPVVASTLLVVAVFDFSVGSVAGLCIGSIKLDSETESTQVARLSRSDPETRGTVSQVYALSLSAAPHTIKLRAKRSSTSGASCEPTGTSLLYVLLS